MKTLSYFFWGIVAAIAIVLILGIRAAIVARKPEPTTAPRSIPTPAEMPHSTQSPAPSPRR